MVVPILVSIPLVPGEPCTMFDACSTCIQLHFPSLGLERSRSSARVHTASDFRPDTLSPRSISTTMSATLAECDQLI